MPSQLVSAYADRLERETENFACDFIQGCTTQEEGEMACKDSLLGHAGFVPDNLKMEVIAEVVSRFGYLVDDMAVAELQNQQPAPPLKQFRNKPRKATLAKQQHYKNHKDRWLDR